ncbi:hypothetical protein, partial [Plasmodium yoelii yoelii]
LLMENIIFTHMGGMPHYSQQIL